MKAITYSSYGDISELKMSYIALPEPAKGMVRVKVLACAVNLSDWEYLTGSPAYIRLVAGLKRPKRQVLGSDIVGEVDKLGPDVSDFKLGDRILGDVVMLRGGFAEFACIPAKEMALVPAGMGDDIAACLPQAGGIAVAGTQGITPGTRVLINGAGGGSGTLALQLAKAAGAHVTVVDNAHKTGWLQSLGADETIDYRVQDFVTSGKKWDYILDMVATRSPGQIAKALNKQGAYKAVGGKVSVLLSLLLGGLFYRLKGKHIGMLMVPAGRDLTQRVVTMAERGEISPHLDAVLPLDAVPAALQSTGNGEVKGKIVIKL